MKDKEVASFNWILYIPDYKIQAKREKFEEIWTDLSDV